MSNTIRIDEELEEALLKLQKVFSKRLNTKVSFVRTTRITGKLLNGIDPNEINLERLHIRGRPSRRKLKKVAMELDFRL